MSPKPRPWMLMAGFICHNIEFHRLHFVGWRNPLKIDTSGYCIDDFFDDDSRYRGPDKYGVEPMFLLPDSDEARKI